MNKARDNLKDRLDVCIDIFHKLYSEGGDFCFEIYGIEAEDYLHVFPEHSVKLQEMAECTIFKGRQPNKLVLKRISKSDFSIFFRDETQVTLAGFPGKLAESISCGTPVISNKMVSLDRYADSEGLFLAVRGEEFSLVKQLMSLSASEINAIKQRAYNSQTFDYRNHIEKVSEFIAKVEI